MDVSLMGCKMLNADHKGTFFEVLKLVGLLTRVYQILQFNLSISYIWNQFVFFFSFAGLDEEGDPKGNCTLHVLAHGLCVPGAVQAVLTRVCWVLLCLQAVTPRCCRGTGA